MTNVNVFSLIGKLRGGAQIYPIKYQQFRRRTYTLLTYTYVQLLGFHSVLYLHMHDLDGFERCRSTPHIRAQLGAPWFCSDWHTSVRWHEGKTTSGQRCMWVNEPSLPCEAELQNNTATPYSFWFPGSPLISLKLPESLPKPRISLLTKHLDS